MDLKAIDRLLTGLNEHQLRAVNVGTGQAAVLGSPGSGKTWTLIGRLARLARDGFDLKWCLAMTFTRYAAGEINSRLVKLGLPAGRVGTIHSLCNEILLSSGMGLVQGRQVDETGWKLQMILKRRLSDDRYKNYRYDLDEIIRFMEHCKATGMCPVFGNVLGANGLAIPRIEKIATHWAGRTGLPDWKLADLYSVFEADKIAHGIYDFDDMQLWAWMLLVCSSAALAEWRNRWSMIITDESQDQTPVQWDMAFLLSGKSSSLVEGVEAVDREHSLMALGDTSQSLYAFRSASPEIFSDFATDPATELITLPINYRSVPEICKAGSGMVLGEKWHLGGEMVSGRTVPSGIDLVVGEGPIRLEDFPSVGDEAQWVIAECARLREITGSWRSMAVLSRLSTFLGIAEIECIRRGIPYEKRCHNTFAGGKEVVGLVGYLRVAGGWDRMGKAERAIVNVPFRYIGRKSLDMADMKHPGGPGYIHALLEHGNLSLRQQRSLQDLQTVLENLRAKIEDGVEPQHLIGYVLARTEFTDSLRREGGGLSPDAMKLAAVQQVEWLAGLFKKAEEFIAFMDQLNEGVKLGQRRLMVKDASVDALVLGTLHSAKGLSWPIVFMSDVVNGRHPWSRAHSLAEELRLAYVGFTRAERLITVTHSMDGNGVDSFIVKKLRGLVVRLTATENPSGSEAPVTE